MFSNSNTGSYMFGTTPRTISGAVRQFCREISPRSAPRFIKVTPAPGAPVKECFPIVERHVQRHGGSVCYGWQIWEWPGVMIEAEFHAVWKDAAQQLHDLTPKTPPIDKILFLPDPDRVYSGRQVNNVRRALSDKAEIRRFIEAADAEFELTNRGTRAEQHGEIALSGVELQEFAAIQDAKVRAFGAIVAHLPKPGRNDLCPCGSGKKLKKCHPM